MLIAELLPWDAPPAGTPALESVLASASFGQAAGGIAAASGLIVRVVGPSREPLWPDGTPGCVLRQTFDGCDEAAAAQDVPCVRTEIELDDGGQSLGYVVCCQPAGNAGVESLSRLRAAAEAVAAVIWGLYRAEAETGATVAELTATYEELAVVYEIAQVAAALPPGPSLVRWCLERAAESLQLHAGCFLLLQSDGTMGVTAAFGLPADQREELPGAIARAFATSAARQVSAGTIVNHDAEVLAVDAAWQPWAAVFQTIWPPPWMAMPLRNSGQLMGLLAGHRAGPPGAFSSRDLKLLQAAARQVSLALRNSRLADELQHLFIATVRGLAAAIDAKDPYTRGHSDRVAHLAAFVGEELELPLRDQRDLVLASLLHDVGKIGVPEAVLQKPGELNDGEWLAIREHPQRGADIVSEVRQLGRIVPSIRHHHERFGGGGYPQGMSGREIPLAARIIGACDAYDAMTSARPYRRPLEPHEATAELLRCRGTQFDPAVVTALLKRLADGPLLSTLGDPTAFLGTMHTLVA